MSDDLRTHEEASPPGHRRSLAVRVPPRRAMRLDAATRRAASRRAGRRTPARTAASHERPVVHSTLVYPPLRDAGPAYNRDVSATGGSVALCRPADVDAPGGRDAIPIRSPSWVPTSPVRAGRRPWRSAQSFPAQSPPRFAPRIPVLPPREMERLHPDGVFEATFAGPGRALPVSPAGDRTRRVARARSRTRTASRRRCRTSTACCLARARTTRPTRSSAPTQTVARRRRRASCSPCGRPTPAA